MPLTRYQLRNEYSLADPDLYQTADNDDSEALLEAVAMAGLVGLLRQLGDLAEFAAEVFHDLHEEVMATAARGHGLIVRVRQLEAEVPAVEKPFLSQNNHLSFFTNAGVDWHPLLHTNQNLITRDDLPRCVMDSYEECWGPPRFFLLDKFDVAGTGACLKRYTDPSFFKNETASSEIMPLDVQREKKMLKTKKKKGPHWKNGETPESFPTSHARLQQLFLEERIENAFNDPARLVKLKKRQLNGSPLDLKSGKSYMEKFLQIPSPEHKAVYETSVDLPMLNLASDNSSESGMETVEIGTISPVKRSSEIKESICSSPNSQEMALKPPMEGLHSEVSNWEIAKAPELAPAVDTDRILPFPPRVKVENGLVVNGEQNKKSNLYGDIPDDMTGEVEHYMDALATMESDMEAENEHNPNSDLGVFSGGKCGTDSDANKEFDIQGQSSDSQPLGVSTVSDDRNGTSMKYMWSFSDSGTICNTVENVPSNTEEAAQAFTGAVNSASENETSSTQLPTYVDIQGSSPIGLVQANDAIIDEGRNPDLGEASGSSYVTDTNINYVPVDPKVSSGVSPEEHELDEAPSNNVRPDSESLRNDELGFNRSISFEVVSVDHSQTNLVCTDSPPVDELHGVDKTIFSMHLSKSSELDPEYKSRCNVLDQVCQMDSVVENGEENSALLMRISRNSTTIPLEEQLSSVLPEIEVHSDKKLLPDMFEVMRPGNSASEVDSLSKVGINSVHTTPLVAILQSKSTNEQRPDSVHSDTGAHSHNKLLPDMFEVLRPGNSASAVDALSNIRVNSDFTTPLVEIFRSRCTNEQLCERVHDVPNVEPDLDEIRESNLDKVSEPADGGEIRQLSCTAYGMGRTAVTLDHKAIRLDGSDLKGHLGMDDPSTKAVLSDGVAMSTACGTIFDDDYDNLSCQSSSLIFSPSGPPMSAEEHHSSAGVPHEQVQKFTERIYPESLVSSKANTDQVKVSTKDSGSAVNKPGSCDYSHREDVVQNSTLTEPMGTAILGELTCSPPSHMVDLDVESKLLFSTLLPGSKEDIVAPPNPDSETHIDQKVRYASREISPGDLPSQPPIPTVGAFAQSVDQKIDSNKHPSASLHSGFGLVHEATHVGMVVMPPLPPLPPMQWRMGKAQLNCQDSQRELVEHAEGSFPLSEYGADRKDQLEFSASEIQSIDSGNICPPLEAVEEKQHHVSQKSVVSFVQPTGSVVDMSNMVNEASIQCTGTSFKNMQSSSPDSVVEAMPSKRPEHGSPDEENDREQSRKPFPQAPDVEQTTSGHDPMSLLENQTETSDQYIMDTATEDSIFQAILPGCGTQVENSLDMSVTQPANGQEQPPNNQEKQAPDNIEEHPPPNDEVQRPTEAEEHPQHDLATLGGEMQPTSIASIQHCLPISEAVPLSHSKAPSLACENGKKNGNPAANHPRPRDPLIDILAAIDKSRLRKVSKQVKPQVGSKVDERDSFLEQIRAKSFNLRPAGGTRPSIQRIQGPKTNLRVAAILEKANAIRQATAGSDEEYDNDDSWSGS